MPYYTYLYQHDPKFREELLEINAGRQLYGEEIRNGKTILWSLDKNLKFVRLKMPKGWVMGENPF